MAADRPLQRVQRDDVAGALPDRAEMGVAQQPAGREFLDVADAAAHLQRIAADLARIAGGAEFQGRRSEEHTSELQSHLNLVCRLLLEKKKNTKIQSPPLAT